MPCPGSAKGIGGGYLQRVPLEDFIDLAEQFKQRAFHGIGFARWSIGS